MTDTPTESHSSSTAIDIALLKERHRESIKRDEQIMDALMDIQTKQHEMLTLLALGESRFKTLEVAQASSALRLDAVEADKRGPVAVILATLAALATGATAWLK